MVGPAHVQARAGPHVLSLDAPLQFCLTIKVLFTLPLRQTTGMVASLLRMANLDRAVPDCTNPVPTAKDTRRPDPVSAR